MRLGTFRDRISIEGNVAGLDDEHYGPQPGGWGVLHSRIWANVKDLMPSNSEAVKEGMQINTTRTRVRTRYLTGLDSSMRVIVHGKRGDPDRVLSIVGGPAVMGHRRGIELMCESYSVGEV